MPRMILCQRCSPTPARDRAEVRRHPGVQLAIVPLAYRTQSILTRKDSRQCKLQQRHAVQSGTYTIEQLAGLLNCSLRHVRRLDADGNDPWPNDIWPAGPAFSRRQVDAWLNGETGQAPLKLHR